MENDGKGCVLLLAGLFLLGLALVLPISRVQIWEHNEKVWYQTCVGRFMHPGDNCFYQGMQHTYEEWQNDTRHWYDEAASTERKNIIVSFLGCTGFGLLCTFFGLISNLGIFVRLYSLLFRRRRPQQTAKNPPGIVDANTHQTTFEQAFIQPMPAKAKARLDGQKLRHRMFIVGIGVLLYLIVSSLGVWLYINWHI